MFDRKKKERIGEYLFFGSLLEASRLLSEDLSGELRLRGPLLRDWREIWLFLHDLHTTENRSW